jgi:hypothetical protein
MSQIACVGVTVRSSCFTNPTKYRGARVSLPPPRTRRRLAGRGAGGCVEPGVDTGVVRTGLQPACRHWQLANLVHWRNRNRSGRFTDKRDRCKKKSKGGRHSVRGGFRELGRRGASHLLGSDDFRSGTARTSGGLVSSNRSYRCVEVGVDSDHGCPTEGHIAAGDRRIPLVPTACHRPWCPRNGEALRLAVGDGISA